MMCVTKIYSHIYLITHFFSWRGRGRGQHTIRDLQTLHGEVERGVGGDGAGHAPLPVREAGRHQQRPLLPLTHTRSPSLIASDDAAGPELELVRRPALLEAGVKHSTLAIPQPPCVVDSQMIPHCGLPETLGRPLEHGDHQALLQLHRNVDLDILLQVLHGAEAMAEAGQCEYHCQHDVSSPVHVCHYKNVPGS